MHIAYGQQSSTPRRRQPDTRIGGEHAINKEALSPGDVVTFFHNKQPTTAAVVMEVRDEWMDIVKIGNKPDSASHGYAQTTSLADRGLVPYGQQTRWNDSNHTQATGVNISTYLPDPELAQQIKDNLDSISALQERHGITSELSLASLAQHALLTQAINRYGTSSEVLWQHDIR